MSYYQSTVRYDKMLENGSVKRVSEKYLCDALSIIEAVEVATKNLQPFISGEFEIIKVERTQIAEVMGDNECGKFFSQGSTSYRLTNGQPWRRNPVVYGLSGLRTTTRQR